MMSNGTHFGADVQFYPSMFTNPTLVETPAETNASIPHPNAITDAADTRPTAAQVAKAPVTPTCYAKAMCCRPFDVNHLFWSFLEIICH